MNKGEDRTVIEGAGSSITPVGGKTAIQNTRKHKVKKNIVRSEDFTAVVADSFEIVVDTNKRRGPVIGLKVDPVKGEPFIMPVEFKAAKAMAECILRTLLCVAPELFTRCLTPPGFPSPGMD